jgi:1-acyl-sn-glycerol-3-phosphate acyltransferase
MFRKIIQPFYTFYVAVTFVISVLIALPFIALTSLGDSPKARRGVYLIIRNWSRVWLWMVGMPMTIDGQPMPKGRYIIVANHISYIDTIIIFSAISSYFRPLGKKEISKIPVLGFIYKQIVILVNRESHDSRTKSMRLMWRVIKHEANIVIFPEGTFNETGEPLKSFYDGAFRLALTTGVSILPLVLPDTNDRWHYSGWWKLWPGKNRAKFLEPVSVAGMEMKDMAVLKEKVFGAMVQELVRYANEKK